MVHFDIPWSLMVFQQRNGRIDRYGQVHEPQIRYLLTESVHPRVRGDQRVLEVLIEKDQQASKNLGDPSEFLGVYDQEQEEEKVAEAMHKYASGSDLWSAFEALMDDQARDSEGPLANFIPGDRSEDAVDAIRPLPRLFPDGLTYTHAALRWLSEAGEKLDAGIDGDTFYLTAPQDLQQRLNYLPREVRPEHDHFMLTPNKAAIYREIDRTMHEEAAAWPNLHYLWPLHPVMEWLADRALNAFGRHTAPVLRLPDKLGAQEQIVLLQGGFPNRRGHLLIQDWVGIHLNGEEVVGQLEWNDLQERLDLRPGALANRGESGSTDRLRHLLPIAVDAGRTRLKCFKDSFEADRRDTLAAQRRRLTQLKEQHEQQLELTLARSDQPEVFKKQRREQRLAEIDRVFRDHEDWLKNTQATEDEPYVQVVAVFTGQRA